MSRIVALLFSVALIAPQPARAAQLLLTEPDLFECRLVKTPGYDECNIEYDGQLIYRGPDRASAGAGADCVKCKSVKAAAKKRAMNIVLDREYGWDDEFFLTLTFNSIPAPICR